MNMGTKNESSDIDERVGSHGETIELRFKIGDRVECLMSSSWELGTVVKHWCEMDEEGLRSEAGDDDYYPYKARLDGGGVAYAPEDSDKYIRRSNVPFDLPFQKGARVECKPWVNEDEWLRGTVVSRNPEWFKYEECRDRGGGRMCAVLKVGVLAIPPYMIRIDGKGLIDFWGPQDSIRMPLCAACGKGGAGDGLKTCNGCKMVDYCNATCQKAHWPKHKKECKKHAAALSAGLRFQVGDRVECYMRREWVPGMVVKLRCTRDDDDFVGYPYKVRLDDGEIACAPQDNDDYIRRSTVPPFAMVFDLGARVECKHKDSGWLLGTVVRRNRDWWENDAPPYVIMVDDLGMRNFWGPQECIRTSQVFATAEIEVSNQMQFDQLRFKVGDRVECNCDCGWMPGTIIKTLYREITWVDNVVPYQIQLDNGTHIFAPDDNDKCIRKSSDPPPTCWICFDNEQSETNVIVRDCACRGGENGFVHINCLVQLAIAKTENLESISGDDVNPFTKCITCKSPFSTCSRSISALTKACYQLHCNDPIDSYWKHEAIALMSQEFSRNRDFSGAIELLKNHIASIRLEIAGSELVESFFLIYLFDFLKELADVHEEVGSFEETKVALDEMMVLVEKLDANGVDVRRHRANALSCRGRHFHLTGDKEAALKCYEQCISIAREDAGCPKLHLSFLLSNCAVLNLDLGNKERGIDQLEEVLDIKTTVWGRDNSDTAKVAESLRMLCDGSIDTVPPVEVGLGCLERGLRLAQVNFATADTVDTEIKSSASTKKGKKKGKKGKKKRR